MESYDYCYDGWMHFPGLQNLTPIIKRLHLRALQYFNSLSTFQYSEKYSNFQKNASFPKTYYCTRTTLLLHNFTSISMHFFVVVCEIYKCFF